MDDLRSGDGFPEGLIVGFFCVTLVGMDDGLDVGWIVSPPPIFFPGNLCEDDELRCCC